MPHALLCALIVVCGPLMAAQSGPVPSSANGAAARLPAPAAPHAPDYVIGPEDVLAIVFWHDKDMSAEVVVRPDGRISLPLLNDIDAAGATPEQLRDRVVSAAKRFLADPNVTVVVKQINSRKAFITGAVLKPGWYPLTAPTTVLQLIALAGGLTEFADSEKIVVMRTEGGRPTGYSFNYKHVARRINLRQNIELKPGDTVLVP